MGIIIKQSIKGSVWSYIGVAVGFVTTSYLFPRYLTPDVIGLFSILLAYSALFAQFSAFGFHGVTTRLFPYFRNNENGHNGFLFILLMVVSVGFVLFAFVTHFFLKPVIIEHNIEKSKLFVDYFYLLFPLTFFWLVFQQLDAYNRVLYDTVLGTFLQDFLQRVLIILVTLLFVFKLINLNQLIILYAVAVSAKAVVLVWALFKRGEINLKPKIKFISSELKSEMAKVAVYSVFTGLGGSVVYTIDKIIINQLLGLEQTGIYTIAFFFGMLVIIPSRPLLRISSTLIAEAFKKNDLNYIADIYKRSCLNQFIIGAFLFGGIWINIENILVILGPEYAQAKWVIFFVGIAYLFDMLTGANGQIIFLSKYYKVALYFILILIALVVASMYLLIPEYGIVGAAMAIAVSIIMNNVMRFVFLKVKLKMQPFDWKAGIVLLVFLVALFTATVMPKLILIPDILIRSSIFTIIIFLGIYFTRVSNDINATVNKVVKKIVRPKNS